MKNDAYEQFLKMNKHLNGPLNEWMHLATDMYQHTLQKNLEIVSENVARLSDQLKRLSHIHSTEELLHEQRHIIDEDVKAAVETMQDVIHNNVHSMEELTKACGTLCDPTLMQKFTAHAKAGKHKGKARTERHHR